MALLFRTKKAIPFFAAELEQHRIPFQTRSGESLFETAETNYVLQLMRLIHGTADKMTKAQLLLSPLAGLTLEDIFTRSDLDISPEIIQGINPGPDRKSV